MKKVLLIGLILALVLIFIGGAGVVYARVTGVENGKVLIVTTDQNGNTITRQQFYDENGITTYGEGNLLCQNESQGDCNFSYGPGAMMQGYGYARGGMMGGNGNGYGPGGMMGGRGNGYGPGGMMGGRGNGVGPGMMAGFGVGVMQDYMISAFAEAVGLDPTDVETRLSNGETLTQIATAQGITQEKFTDLVTMVRQAAVDQAVAAGAITQAQADKMLERMNEYTGQGFGPGYGISDCPMFDDDEAQQP